MGQAGDACPSARGHNSPALNHRKELCVSALSLGLICNSGQTGKIPLNFLLDSQEQLTVVISDGGDATQCVQKVVAALAGVVRGLPHQSGSAETKLTEELRKGCSLPKRRARAQRREGTGVLEEGRVAGRLHSKERAEAPG